jgi:hypothetical protein
MHTRRQAHTNILTYTQTSYQEDDLEGWTITAGYSTTLHTVCMALYPAVSLYNPSTRGFRSPTCQLSTSHSPTLPYRHPLSSCSSPPLGWLLSASRGSSSSTPPGYPILSVSIHSIFAKCPSVSIFLVPKPPACLRQLCLAHRFAGLPQYSEWTAFQDHLDLHRTKVTSPYFSKWVLHWCLSSFGKIYRVTHMLFSIIPPHFLEIIPHRLLFPLSKCPWTGYRRRKLWMRRSSPPSILCTSSGLTC